MELNFNRNYFTKHGFHLNNVHKEELAITTATHTNKIIKCSSNENPVIPLQWKDKFIDKNILVNSTLMTNHKTAVDYPSKLESPLIQTHDNQQELIGSEFTRRISHRQKKATITRNSDFLW